MPWIWNFIVCTRQTIFYTSGRHSFGFSSLHRISTPSTMASRHSFTMFGQTLDSSARFWKAPSARDVNWESFQFQNFLTKILILKIVSSESSRMKSQWWPLVLHPESRPFTLWCWARHRSRTTYTNCKVSDFLIFSQGNGSKTWNTHEHSYC